MGTLKRASDALIMLRGKLDSHSAGEHQADALGVLMSLWSDDIDDTWVQAAVAELCRGDMAHVELRACVDRCLQRVSMALVAEAVPRRTTLLPPSSGGDEWKLEREAARASLSSVDLAVNVLGWAEVVPAYSTTPARPDWFDAAEMAAAG